ncbi:MULTISPECIES: hypothetical protein [Rufibacter]|uniref:STAS/SEC14 domain-containing protein n=1 Tax=Rufibacter quisquiliarum TaxID=1549639 RepID=A0A839GMS8_9BACT|nr:MULTISPECIES: hypothetical protein [Rufibacter]MBA9079203.1 hypothetical protein [Rufibacter quisquiliarum]
MIYFVMNKGPITLEQNQQYQVQLFPQDHILMHTWVQAPSSREYQEGYRRYLDFIGQYRIKKIVSDSRARGYSLPEDHLWITHYLVPNLCDKDIRQLALVVPEDPNHARELESCLMTGDACYELKFFHTTADALDWLRSSSSSFPQWAVA